MAILHAEIGAADHYVFAFYSITALHFRDSESTIATIVLPIEQK